MAFYWCTNCDAEKETKADIYGSLHIGCTNGEGYWVGEPDYEAEEEQERELTADDMDNADDPDYGIPRGF